MPAKCRCCIRTQDSERRRSRRFALSRAQSKPYRIPIRRDCSLRVAELHRSIAYGGMEEALNAVLLPRSGPRLVRLRPEVGGLIAAAQRHRYEVIEFVRRAATIAYNAVCREYIALDARRNGSCDAGVSRLAYLHNADVQDRAPGVSCGFGLDLCRTETEMKPAALNSAGRRRATAIRSNLRSITWNKAIRLPALRKTIP